MNIVNVAEAVRANPVIAAKSAIALVHDSLPKSAIQNGDDCAAIPEADGSWLLLAAEGIIPALLKSDPELAGRSAVLANVNDIYAMGGRPLALVDVVGTPDSESLRLILKGMRDNAARFGVPIVGGHLQPYVQESMLAMAILGRAQKLITSFDAKAYDILVLVTNMDGLWLEKANYYNCTQAKHDANLIHNLELLPQAAEKGLVKSGKDVSNAGIAGTLLMLCECSKVGCILECDAIPSPKAELTDENLAKWLTAFFSYGFILALKEKDLADFAKPFLDLGLICTKIGKFIPERKVFLKYAASKTVLRDLENDPLLGW